jgi:hypothetical protein
MRFDKARTRGDFPEGKFMGCGIQVRERAWLEFVLILTLLFAMNVDAAVDIKHDEFAFKLRGDWIRVPGSDTNQFSFESKSNKTSVVLTLEALTISQDKLVEVAKKFAEIRQKAEQDSRKGQTIQFGDTWVELRPSKDVAEVAYAGYDDKAVFRFFGFVTRWKIMSFWVATVTRDNEFSKKVFDDVYRGLKFYVP